MPTAIYPPAFNGRSYVRADLKTTNTGAENWTALTAAADNCNARDLLTGGKHYVWIAPGTYDIDASASYADKMRIHVPPGSVKLVFEVTKPAIRVNQVDEAEGPFTVSAIADAVHPDVSSTDSNAITHRIAFTTIADAANFQRGDAIFLGATNARTYYTENVITYTEGTVNYLAESAIVESVDETLGYVYLAAPLKLWSLFSTGMYAYRLSRTGGPEIDGLDFDTATDPLDELGVTNAGQPVIDLVAVNRGFVVNCTIHRAYHAAISMMSCSRTLVKNNTVLYAPANGTTSYGYGTTCQGACYGCVVDGNHFEACRHGYTGDGYSSTSAFSASRWYQYGDQRACIVMNNKTVGCTGSAYDTHEPSIDTVFMNNIAIDSHRPSHGTPGAQSTLVSGSSNPCLYQIRGRDDKIMSSIGLGCTQGIVIMSPGIQHELISGEGTSPDSKPGLVTVHGLVFDNFYMNNTGFYAIDVWGNVDIAAANQVGVEFHNCSINRFSRGVNIRGGANGRIQFFGGCIRAYDEMLTLNNLANGDYGFFGTVFDSRMQRSGESQITAGATTAGTLTLVNVTARPNATSNFITAASGCTLTVKHANLINAGTGTLTMVGGAGSGTVTKTALTALT